MLVIEHEHVTPHGGWRYICEPCRWAAGATSLMQLRGQVIEHCHLNGHEFSETAFRENVCRSTPYAVCKEVMLAGDLVAKVAQPVAAVIDKAAAVAGIETNVRGCGGCRKRREKLNLLHERLRGKIA